MSIRIAASLLTATATVFSLGRVTVADARSLPAFGGRTLAAADNACIVVPVLGVVQNGCTHAIAYEVGLPADGSAPDEVYSLAIVARSDNKSTDVGCRAFGMRRESNGVIFWYPSTPEQRFVDEINKSVEIKLDVYVPPGGALFVHCDLQPGGILSYITYQ